MTRVKWLWGNERWDGCGAPWDHNVLRCPLCSGLHGTMVPKGLAQCLRWGPEFKKAWSQSEYMGQVYRERVHEIDYAYHVLGLRHALIIKILQRHEGTFVYDVFRF